MLAAPGIVIPLIREGTVPFAEAYRPLAHGSQVALEVACATEEARPFGHSVQFAAASSAKLPAAQP